MTKYTVRWRPFKHKSDLSYRNGVANVGGAGGKAVDAGSAAAATVIASAATGVYPLRLCHGARSPGPTLGEPVDQPGPLPGLVTLAVPIMLNNLLQMLYNLVDAWFLGRIGAAAVSAPTISFTLIFFLVIFGVAFSMAGTTLIAQSKGRGDMERANFYAGQVTTLLLVAMSVVISVVGLVATPTLLRVMQVPAEAFEYTRQYMTIIFAAMPFMFVSFLLRAVLQGVGDSMTPLIVQVITIGLNVVLDPILIFGWGPFPAMEVAGAAYATVFARLVAAASRRGSSSAARKGIRLTLANLNPTGPAIGG